MRALKPFTLRAPPAIQTQTTGEKAKKALEYLIDGDFVFLHVEAPDEMGHEGDMKGEDKGHRGF